MNPSGFTCTPDGSSTICVYDYGTTTPLITNDGSAIFGIEILVFLGFVMFAAFLFNGFGMGRR